MPRALWAASHHGHLVWHRLVNFGGGVDYFWGRWGGPHDDGGRPRLGGSVVNARLDLDSGAATRGALDESDAAQNELGTCGREARLNPSRGVSAEDRFARPRRRPSLARVGSPAGLGRPRCDPLLPRVAELGIIPSVMSAPDLNTRRAAARSWLRAHPAVVACVYGAFGALVFSRLAGNRLSGPLAGAGDVSIWEYMGYYVSRNLRFSPFPQLDLTTDQAFFPYGTSSVFQPWAPERDAFFAVFFSLGGPGSWLQVYYILSIFITLVGAYGLLREEFGTKRAVLTGLLITFLNFYAVAQYPNHFNICIMHWTVLSFLADFVIVRRVVLRRALSLRLALLRLALVSLSLGQDLGYVAGFALMSFVLSTGFVVFLTAWRWWSQSAAAPSSYHDLCGRIDREARQHKLTICALSLLFVGSTFAYSPVALQIASTARSSDFAGMPSGASSSRPWRLLLPYLPSLDPGSGMVGWTLLVLGAGGLYCARRSWQMYVPALTMLLLCLAYRPIDFPTLKIFPWFAFARIAGRVTAIYPLLFAIFALSFDPGAIGPRGGRMLTGILAILGAVELHTSFFDRNEPKLYEYSTEFFAYMQVVRRQPGEALLDWPFCITGGNGVGSAEGLCPYYEKNHDDLGYAPYHQKKLVGGYFGRLHPSQLEPFLRAHWEHMFAPDDVDVFRARAQTRCLDQDEWSFFSDFFALNDFAGLQLHTSLVPPSCAEQFFARFGQPVARLSLPDGDDLAFVPKPTALRSRVDATLGRRVTLRRDFAAGAAAVSALAQPAPLSLDLDGLSGLEHSAQEDWRWGLGARTSLEFSLPEGRSLNLRFIYFNPPQLSQRVRLVINGTVARTYVHEAPGARIVDAVKFDGNAGTNHVDFICDAFNGRDGAWFTVRDRRPMSIRFTQLVLE